MAPEERPRPGWVVPAACAVGALLAILVLGVGPTLILAGIAAAALGFVAIGGKSISGLSTTAMKVGAIGAGVVLMGAGSAATVPTAPQASLRPFAELSTASPSAEREPAPSTTPSPRAIVTHEELVVTQPVPFTAVTQEDPNLDVGTSVVIVAGVVGERTITYRVVYTDGVETARKQLSDVVTTAPIDEITAIGTRTPPPPKPAPVVGGRNGSGGGGSSGGCDPNYDASWACVPIASDVDCAGGSGNGPAYVKGPVRVIGSDIYDLDRDGDGIGCD